MLCMAHQLLQHLHFNGVHLHTQTHTLSNAPSIQYCKWYAWSMPRRRRRRRKRSGVTRGGGAFDGDGQEGVRMNYVFCYDLVHTTHTPTRAKAHTQTHAHTSHPSVFRINLSQQFSVGCGCGLAPACTHSVCCCYCERHGHVFMDSPGWNAILMRAVNKYMHMRFLWYTHMCICASCVRTQNKTRQREKSILRRNYMCSCGISC